VMSSVDHVTEILVAFGELLDVVYKAFHSFSFQNVDRFSYKTAAMSSHIIQYGLKDLALCFA
jgi:hypothetical protein